MMPEQPEMWKKVEDKHTTVDWNLIVFDYLGTYLGNFQIKQLPKTKKA